MNDVQNELERLRREVAELKKMLGERQQLEQPKNLPDLSRDQSFIEDMARFTSGVLSEKQIRRKYHVFDEATWERLGSDEALIEAIELAEITRTRSGATKRELAQNHIVAAPSILNSIMADPNSNARHKVDAIKCLDSLADPQSQTSHDDSDRVIVSINLGNDSKLIFDKPLRPTPTDDKTIDAVPGFMIATEKDDRGGEPL